MNAKSMMMIVISINFIAIEGLYFYCDGYWERSLGAELLNDICY